MPASLPTLGRLERVILAVALGGIAATYCFAARYRLDPLDEGYFLYTSSRILAGDLPYRDFSTPYTPAFFFLNALLFKMFGTDVVTLRLSLVLARIALLLVVYVLGRRIMPPAFAAIPGLLMLAEDNVPAAWESHPAWWATLGYVASVWFVCKYAETGAWRWWGLAAAAVAASGAFKQTVGILGLAMLLGVCATEWRALPATAERFRKALRSARLIRVVRDLLPSAAAAYLVAVMLALSWLMRRDLDLLTTLILLAPLGMLAFERRARPPMTAQRDGDVQGRAAAATVARVNMTIVLFAVVTATWVAPLIAALGVGGVPWRQFVGIIDTAGYALPIEALRPALIPVLLIPLALCASAVVWVRTTSRRTATVAYAISAGLVGLSVIALVTLAQAAHPRLTRGLSFVTVDATTNLVLYLPLVSFVAALYFVRRQPRDTAQHLATRWILLASVFLMLNQYPRNDVTHMLWSGVLAWVAGSWALYQTWLVVAAPAATTGPPTKTTVQRVALYAALLSLPFLAAWPMIELRRLDLATRVEGSLISLRIPKHVPLGIPRASVLEREELADKYRQIVAFFDARSEPADSVFVYPAAPLLYYLIDRPNATRFNHVFAGLLSHADEIETISRLNAVPARYVIWDSFGATYWNPPGSLGELTDYIWKSYTPVASIGGYEILERK